MTITITIEGHSAEHVRDEMARLLGSTAIVVEEAQTLEEALRPGPAIKVPDEPVTQQQAEALVETAKSVFTHSDTPMTSQVVRERGKPSPGHARRTKEEIAEDKAADERDAALAAAGEETGAIVPDKHVEVEGAADSPEDVAQDAADEAAETAEQGKALTLDDLRKASGMYAHKFGVAAASEDIRDIIGKPLLEVSDDELADAIAKVNNAVRLNPKERAVLNGAAPTVADAVKPAGKRTATKADVAAALGRYALKFDGQNTDPNNMPITTEDGRKALAMRFGEGVTKLSQITTPEDYGQALTDIESMIAKNPFSREVKVA